MPRRLSGSPVRGGPSRPAPNGCPAAFMLPTRCPRRTRRLAGAMAKVALLPATERAWLGGWSVYLRERNYERVYGRAHLD